MANLDVTVPLRVYPREIARLLRDELISAGALAREYRDNPGVNPHAVKKLSAQIQRCNELYEALEAGLR